MGNPKSEIKNSSPSIDIGGESKTASTVKKIIDKVKGKTK